LTGIVGHGCGRTDHRSDRTGCQQVPKVNSHSNPFPAVCSGYRAAVTLILRRSEAGVTPASAKSRSRPLLQTTAIYVQVADGKRVEAIDRLDPFGPRE
jgi:hypothetical protein